MLRTKKDQESYFKPRNRQKKLKKLNEAIIIYYYEGGGVDLGNSENYFNQP